MLPLKAPPPCLDKCMTRTGALDLTAHWELVDDEAGFSAIQVNLLISSRTDISVHSTFE